MEDLSTIIKSGGSIINKVMTVNDAAIGKFKYQNILPKKIILRRRVSERQCQKQRVTGRLAIF